MEIRWTLFPLGLRKPSRRGGRDLPTHSQCEEVSFKLSTAHASQSTHEAVACRGGVAVDREGLGPYRERHSWFIVRHWRRRDRRSSARRRWLCSADIDVAKRRIFTPATMGKKNSKLKPDTLRKLTKETYCESFPGHLCYDFPSSWLTITKISQQAPMQTRDLII